MTGGSLSSEQWETIQDLFHRALERPIEERDTFLDSVCADDLEIRREVDSLLAAHEAGGPLGTLEPETDPGESSSGRPGAAPSQSTPRSRPRDSAAAGGASSRSACSNSGVEIAGTGRALNAWSEASYRARGSSM